MYNSLNEIKEEIATWRDQHKEMILGRLISDCQQWFFYDNTVRLWACTVSRHMLYVKVLFEEVKPKYIEMEQIKEFGIKMKKLEKALDK